VTTPVAYHTWEGGQDNRAPEPLASAMKMQEQLLWAATVPSGRLSRRRLCGIAFFLGLAVWFVLEAPWGQSVAEYCAKSNSSRCGLAYLLVWPSAGFLAWFTSYLILLTWKNHIEPWQVVYGVSTERALKIDGNKPGKVHSTPLSEKSARIDWIGDVRFDRSRTGFAFPGLDEQDARRAVYWANEGRLPTHVSGGALQ
jgi:hypothetical protein